MSGLNTSKEFKQTSSNKLFIHDSFTHRLLKLHHAIGHIIVSNVCMGTYVIYLYTNG